MLSKGALLDVDKIYLETFSPTQVIVYVPRKIKEQCMITNEMEL